MAPSTAAGTVMVTRVVPPVAPARYVVREHLLGPLRVAVEDPRVALVLVSAAAGAGKTTLLGALADEFGPGRDQDVAWLQVEAVDRDPSRFWAGVAAAVDRVRPGIAEVVAGAARATGGAGEATVPVLVNLLHAGPPLLIVLDDLHLVDSRTVHDGLTLLLDRLPPQVTVAIGSRTDPPLRLGRLRVRGRMIELRADDLRFQIAEASAMLGAAQGLDTDQVEHLCRRTEGWAAGLVLAGLSLRRSDDTQTFVDSFGGDDGLVSDYLTDELLDSLADHDRDTLVASCVVDRLCGPLVDRLTGRDDGTQWLVRLAAANQLLRPLDSTGTWYRHHQLVLDLLRAEATHSLPDLLPDLHRRAATWLGEHGEPEPAVRHLVQAGDHVQAAAVLAAGLGWRLIATGAADTLHRMLAEVGDAAEGVTGCVLQAGWCALVRNEIDVAGERLARARAMRQDDNRALDPLYDALEINIALCRGDVAAALDSALPVLVAGRLSESMSPMATSVGMALAWAGHLDDARRALEIARRRAEVDAVTTVHVLAWIYLALAEVETGTRSAARDAADRALDSARQRGLAGYQRLALAHAVRAATATDPQEAASDVDRALELARLPLGALDAGYVHAIAADVHLNAGSPDGADLLRRAQQITDGCLDPGVLGSRLRRVRDRHRLAESAPTSTPGSIEALTDRELAVLRLLSGRLSQRQIAAELFVSLNTVKTHSRGIFRKLGAGDRRHAVQRARELGLL